MSVIPESWRLWTPAQRRLSRLFGRPWPPGFFTGCCCGETVTGTCTPCGGVSTFPVELNYSITSTCGCLNGLSGVVTNIACGTGMCWSDTGVGCGWDSLDIVCNNGLNTWVAQLVKSPPTGSCTSITDLAPAAGWTCDPLNLVFDLTVAVLTPCSCSGGESVQITVTE